MDDGKGMRNREEEREGRKRGEVEDEDDEGNVPASKQAYALIENSFNSANLLRRELQDLSFKNASFGQKLSDAHQRDLEVLNEIDNVDALNEKLRLRNIALEQQLAAITEENLRLKMSMHNLVESGRMRDLQLAGNACSFACLEWRMHSYVQSYMGYWGTSCVLLL